MSLSTAVAPLSGLVFRRLGRAQDLTWFWFGEESAQKGEGGKDIVRPEYALHVQCAFRLSVNEDIVLASRDLYLGDGDGDEGDFDVKARAVNAMVSSDRFDVVAARLTPHSGLELDLSGGARIEVFPDNSSGLEYWRLISFGTPPRHYIAPDCT